MAEDSVNKKDGLAVGGISGSKMMRAGRVRKKKTDDTAAAEKEVKVEAAPVVEETAEEVKKPASKTTAAKKAKAEAEAEAEPKEEKKTAKAKTSKTAKASEEKAKEEEKPSEEPAKKTTRKTASKAKAEVAEEEAKPAKTTKKKTAKAEKAEEVPAEESKPEAEAAESKDAVKEETPVKETPEEVKEPVKAAEEKEAPKEPAKPKLSSAVISLPDQPGRAVKNSTYIAYDRKSPVRRDDNRGGYRQGGQGGQGRGPRPDRGDRGGRGDASFMKDKDDDQPSRPMQRKPSKPKAESPVDEVKKSRANFAERNAIEKKHNDADRRDRTQSGDKRKQSRNQQYEGRMGADGEYDDYSFRKKKKKANQGPIEHVEQVITHIQLPPFITVKEFAEGIGKKSSDVIMELMKLGVMANINQELDFDTAFMLADSFGIEAEPITEVTEEDILFDEGEDNPETLETRPPVVVVMGHVDHGKTSLLDKIRSTNVIEGEAGGITQHIGAYTVRLKGRQITFLDTPGHEAFTTMRARGAQFTDIAILVVAADDGVMPQTIEAINHAKAANTEIIVAINKIDKPGANIDKVKQELSNYELLPEEWGGSTIMVPVSAKKGEGIDDLLESVLLVADVMELKADPKRQAKGAVIEAQLDKNRGPVASVLVQRGTLRQGDSVVCGAMMGNVRAMYDDKGNPIKKAGPSIPVEILGLPEVPEAGEELYVVTDEKVARQLVEKRKIKQREAHIHQSSRMSLDNLAAQMAAGDVKDLNLIVKADVQGSVEAVIQSLEKLSNEEVNVKVIHGAVGAINESDVVLADVSNAIIIGFNVRPNQVIVDKAKEAGVDIRLYNIIYKAIEDVELAMKGMLAPVIEEVVLGHAEIRELFKVSGLGTIGGSYVTDGKIVRNCGVRVIRQDVVIYTGKLGSLQRLKDAVKEVNSGFECGLTIENYNDIKVGDIVEAYDNVEVERE
ncbi:MAG: translation initiation factor IF-2 [Saccharofermentans sp.]|nr:translation initiation factor IF-2 [Saccharofermentans sp.]